MAVSNSQQYLDQPYSILLFYGFCTFKVHLMLDVFNSYELYIHLYPQKLLGLRAGSSQFYQFNVIYML